MYRKLLQIISLYEIAPFGIFLNGLAASNVFLIVFALAILSKHLPEQFIKRLVPVPDTIKSRPVDAMDCGMLNDGGPYNKKPGFPSGHTTTAWFIFTYVLLLQSKINQKCVGLMIITSLFAVLVPYSRVALHCHTLTQVSAGALLGSVWAWLFFLFEQNVLIHNERYKQDRERLIRLYGR